MTIQVEMIPIAEIKCVSQVRERFDGAQAIELMESMREQGLLQPVRLRRIEGAYCMTDGERRLRAAIALGWTTMPAIVDEAELSDAQVTQQQLVSNCQRENLSPLELARALKRLTVECGMPATEVAKKVGLSESSISRALSLLVLPPALQERVQSGQIAASTGYEIAKIADPRRRAELVRKALEGRVTRDSVSRRPGAAPRTRDARSRRRALPRGKRVSVELGGGRAITMAGPDLSLSAIVEWVEELLRRIRELGRQDLDLDEAVRAISARKG